MLNYKQEEIVSHLKHYGFVFQSSEIYGGLANTWDYGPLGVMIKNKVKKLWWDYFINQESNNYGIDSSIILSSDVWKASSHLDTFNDLLVDCKNCKSRFRLDHLIKEDITENDLDLNSKMLMKTNCPKCSENNWTQPRHFNLMFEILGSLIDHQSKVYLRPETAQGIFINFKNICRILRSDLPFGIGQIGKSFRNEITPGNFIFRTKEFEQMELEFFSHPSNAENWFAHYDLQIQNFLSKIVGIRGMNFRRRIHAKTELSHYSTKTIDFEYRFPFGWSELWGLSYRGSYDLEQHEKHSGQNFHLKEENTENFFLPHVVEPSVGVERLLYAILCDSYKKEVVNKDSRVLLSLNWRVAPYTMAFFPLNKKITDSCKTLFLKLKKDALLGKLFNFSFDDKGSIGKRYRRQDAIGTPYCLTYDFQSSEDEKVTIRERDTMHQKRISIKEIRNFLLKTFKYL